MIVPVGALSFKEAMEVVPMHARKMVLIPTESRNGAPDLSTLPGSV